MNPFFTVDGKPFFVIGGQTHNSSAYNRESLSQALAALKTYNGNTLEAPIYWGQVEPREGTYHFETLDGLVQTARENNLKLVLLWFGTWKNGCMEYTPSWVKSDPQRFRRVVTPTGEDTWVLSSHCKANLQADRKAFCRLMERLKQIDGSQKTVIAVQVENEPGILGSARDFSSEAEAEFRAEVPAAARAALAPGRPAGNWETLFGEDAAEIFTAWSIASYIDQIAEAGKQIYDLPLYVNVWLRENGWRLPGLSFPSGGAVSNRLDLWKAAARHINLIAPDIYVENREQYRSICTAYARKDNPLFVPESGHGVANAMNLFEAAADFGVTGYAIFGIETLLTHDGSPRPEALQVIESMRCLGAAAPLLVRYHGTGKIHAVTQQEFLPEQILEFGAYHGRVDFDLNRTWTDYSLRGASESQRGRGLIIEAGPREFYLTGGGFRLTLKARSGDKKIAGKTIDFLETRLSRYLSVEEGHFTPAGEWVTDKTRNGDEIDSGVWVHPSVGVVRVLLTE